MSKFLDLFDLPKLNQGNINHLNRSITSINIESVIKSLPIKSPGLHEFTDKFFMTFFFGRGVLRAYTLSHYTSPIVVTGFFEIGSMELFAQAGFVLQSS
jgi:hypothetical protein